jgi:hypothetical protein
MLEICLPQVRRICCVHWFQKDERFLHTLCILYPSLAPNADNNVIRIPNREGDIEREDNKDGAHVRGGSVAD